LQTTSDSKAAKTLLTEKVQFYTSECIINILGPVTIVRPMSIHKPNVTRESSLATEIRPKSQSNMASVAIF